MEPARPLANFPPSIWGDRFLSFSLDNLQLEAYAKAMEEPKEQLRGLINDQTIDSTKKLSLIYYVYRLGLSYLFAEDIDEQVDKLHNELNLEDYHEADLHTISIHFQVFRCYGYKLSCDVFKKFKDCSSGAFKEDIITDVRAMLSFYECAQLRIRGEWILDEAFVFTEAQLKIVEKKLEGVLAWQVKHALETSFHRGHQMVEARLYLLNYEEECSTYDPRFNMFYECISITINFLRWEISAMEQLPEYIKPFYEILLKEYDGLKQQLAEEGRAYLVDASKQAFQEQARAYLQEAEWRHSGEVPSFEEYMKIGLITSGHGLLSKSSLIGMGMIANEKAFAWYKSHPKILTASETISRLHGDVMTFEFERERAKTATGVEAYMKTFGVSGSVAVSEIMKMVENAWKDINEGCLKPREVAMDLLAPIVNLTRMIDVVYRYNDGFTFPEKTLKEYITLLFLDSTSM